MLKSAVQKAKLGNDEELAALKRLDDQAKQLERVATGPDFGEFVTQENPFSVGKNRRWHVAISKI